ncbi:MAG: RDD family protein [Alphaproteobacteria bacterium]|nr:RDD family protein [Alphaproteobacteria bacterium]
MANIPSSGPSVPPPPPVWDARPQGIAHAAYGGFWIRVVAYIIDAIVLGVASAIIAMMVGGSFLAQPGTSSEIAANLVSVVIGWLYFALLESSTRGATLGKMAVGLRVVTNDGQQLSFLHATGRYFAKFISALILCIGFIMVAFSERNRGLHDMIAGTLVVKAG